eukprot:TRINITY_DN3315_c0_g1_i5.p1 TRINITY_DN3315_c0_g1~~TRINITY_DN3315_c0_g1_i5.p1  ORF type:complete len:197 (-),score=16.98 TRINITY_DN3315_c0_g1_i5:204-794(-)
MPGETLASRCDFLAPGTRYEGTQKVPTNREDAWIVTVNIQGYEPERGYICGSMEAHNLPTSEDHVVTFWEGQIIDNCNYSFYTGKWDASQDKDLEHWSKFVPFRAIKDSVIRGKGLVSAEQGGSRYIFMRWKEQFFVNVNPDCGLTIAGFYYVCFDTRHGTVEGFYHDANSSPWQQLSLKVSMGDTGQCFEEYEFA